MVCSLVRRIRVAGGQSLLNGDSSRFISPIIAMLALVLLGAVARTTQAATPPNFVIIIADDMAWDDCGAYGHPKIRTPNIDQLAQQGMRFDRAFLTCSSCSPSRASIMTGRYPHATGAPELHMSLPADQVLFTTPLRKAGYFTAAAGKWHLGKDAEHQFDLIRHGGDSGGAGHWIPLLRERPKDKPFFMWFASFDPHRPYQPNTIPQPHSGGDTRVPPFLPDVDDTRADLAMYYDEIARLDGNVGNVLEELQRQGVADNTWILFLSDNGRPFPRCKTTVFDSGVRTPFIVRWPGHVAPDSVSESIVSSVDIAPTILQIAGLMPLPSFQGKSFLPILEDPKAETRRYAFAEHNWHDYEAFERGVRSKQYTYFFNGTPNLPATPPADAVASPTFQAMRRLRDQGKLAPHQMGCFSVPRPKEELYDLKTDPYALKNVARDPKYADALDEMRKAFGEWKHRTGDHMPKTLTPDKFDRETGKRLDKAPAKTRKPQSLPKKTSKMDKPSTSQRDAAECLIVAHRGFSAIAPENTLIALRKAAEAGADACEFDVRATRDGAVVLLHDDKVDRTTDGHGSIATLTLAEVKALDAGSWKDPNYAGERIATLDEALTLLRQTQCKAVVEIKAQGIAEPVVRAIRSTDMVDRAVVIAFNHDTVRQVHQLEPRLVCGWLCDKLPETSPTQQAQWLAEKVATCGARLVDANHKALSPELLTALNETGLTVWTWTVNDAERMLQLCDGGVAGLTTDVPDRAVKLLRQR